MVHNIKCDKLRKSTYDASFLFATLSYLIVLFLPAQALHDRAAPPAGQFCGEASRADAETHSLQTSGFSQDPPDHTETEQIHTPQTPRAGLFFYITVFV